MCCNVVGNFVPPMQGVYLLGAADAFSAATVFSSQCKLDDEIILQIIDTALFLLSRVARKMRWRSVRPRLIQTMTGIRVLRSGWRCRLHDWR